MLLINSLLTLQQNRPKNALHITGKQYLNLVLFLRFVVVIKFPEDGVLLPEHVEFGTNSK